MKKVFRIFLPFLLVVFLWASPIFAQNNSSDEIFEAEVIEIVNFGQESYDGELMDFQELKIRITKGFEEGEEKILKNTAVQGDLYQVLYQKYAVGDKLRVYSINRIDGENIYSIMGKTKRPGLVTLTVIFLIVVLVVGRIWGALSVLGMGVSFLVIFKMIIPMIINGINPVFSAFLGSLIIIPITFYISHGFNTKTHVGVVSTTIALLFTGMMAVYFVGAVNLTGYASEEAGFLHVERQGSIDITGLLIAGIIIGTLGILDDVTIGQASVVQQLYLANKKMSIWKLFKQGMKVGQDHVSSMVNTLVLVYAGSSLPLLLLFFDANKSVSDIFEFELIAEEVVRMLVGSIGLVLVAPLATLMAAWAFSRKRINTKR